MVAQVVLMIRSSARAAQSSAETSYLLAKKPGRYAEENGYETRIFPAEWDKCGKSAGYRRNEQMHQYISKAKARGVVAFWQNGSKGTAQNFELAKKYGNQIRIIEC